MKKNEEKYEEMAKKYAHFIYETYEDCRGLLQYHRIDVRKKEYSITKNIPFNDLMEVIEYLHARKEDPIHALTKYDRSLSKHVIYSNPFSSDHLSPKEAFKFETEAKKNLLFTQNMGDKTVRQIVKNIDLHQGEFTVNEYRAVTALMVLVYKKDKYDKLEWYPKLNKASLIVDLNEYFELFPVDRSVRGKDKKERYHGREKANAEEALISLMHKTLLIEYDKFIETKNAKGKIIINKERRRYITQLITPIAIDERIDDKPKVYSKRELLIRDGKLHILVDPLFFSNIHFKGAYFLTPVHLNREIKEALDGKKASAAVYRFNKYVHSLKPGNGGIAKIGYHRLVEVLGLMKYFEQSRKKLIYKRFHEAFEVAITRGVLSKVTEHGTKGNEVYHLHFNSFYFGYPETLEIQEDFPTIFKNKYKYNFDN